MEYKCYMGPSIYIFEKMNDSTLHLKPIITIFSETFL